MSTVQTCQRSHFECYYLMMEEVPKMRAFDYKIEVVIESSNTIYFDRIRSLLDQCLPRNCFITNKSNSLSNVLSLFLKSQNLNVYDIDSDEEITAELIISDIAKLFISKVQAVYGDTVRVVEFKLRETTDSYVSYKV